MVMEPPPQDTAAPRRGAEATADRRNRATALNRATAVPRKGLRRRRDTDSNRVQDPHTSAGKALAALLRDRRLVRPAPSTSPALPVARVEDCGATQTSGQMKRPCGSTRASQAVEPSAAF